MDYISQTIEKIDTMSSYQTVFSLKEPNVIVCDPELKLVIPNPDFEYGMQNDNVSKFLAQSGIKTLPQTEENDEIINLMEWCEPYECFLDPNGDYSCDAGNECECINGHDLRSDHVMIYYNGIRAKICNTYECFAELTTCKEREHLEKEIRQFSIELEREEGYIGLCFCDCEFGCHERCIVCHQDTLIAHSKHVSYGKFPLSKNHDIGAVDAVCCDPECIRSFVSIVSNIFRDR